MSPWAQALIDRALSMTRTRFDRPIMNNIHRAEYVECLVAAVLGDDWRLPWVEDHDWAPWDLRHAPSGTKLEVKQSAARQTWDVDGAPVSRQPRYDIAFRQGRYDDDGHWLDQRSRFADFYVFAWHPVTDAALVDRRDPEQWEFFVLRTTALPQAQNTIGLTKLRALTRPVSAIRLAENVTALVAETRSA